MAIVTTWKKALERFREHQTTACHLLAIDSIVTLPKTCTDIGSSLSDVYKKEVANNWQILRKILENVQFLARQGIAFQGDTDEDSNFFQLFKLRANDDANMHAWLKKQDKYLSQEIQNEMINFIALRIVSNLAEDIRKNGFFSLMADECTDVSNKEQLAICLRHVDHNLVAHEEFIGFYHIPNFFF